VVHEFEDQAEVRLKDKEVEQANNALFLRIFVVIVLIEQSKDLDFCLRLQEIGRFILNDLDCKAFLGALLPTFNHLSEGAFAKQVDDFVVLLLLFVLNDVADSHY